MGIVQRAQLRCRSTLSHIAYPIDLANEINKLLDNFVIINPFFTIFSDYNPDSMTYSSMLERSNYKY